MDNVSPLLLVHAAAFCAQRDMGVSLNKGTPI